MFRPFNQGAHKGHFGLGSDAFRERVMEIVRTREPAVGRDVPLYKQITARCTIDGIKAAVAAECKLSIDSLEQPSRGKHSYARSVAMYLCRQLTTSSYRQIALAFGITSESTVTKHCRKVEDDDPLVQRVVKRLQKRKKRRNEV